MAIDLVAASAEARTLVPGGTYGNVQQVRGTVTLAAFTQNKVAALVRIPAHSTITSVSGTHAALGASTVLEIGYEAVDESPSDPDAFADVADSSSAGVFATPNATSQANSPAGVAVTEDTYITVKQTAVATGAGVVTVLVQYEYVGI